MNRRHLLAAAPLALGIAGLPTAGRAADSADSDILLAARFQTDRRFVTTPFGDISLIDRGSGPAVLFLHGFPLNGFQWRGVIDRLDATRRCIAPDFLGLGYTRVSAGQAVTPAAQAAMVADLLDRLSISNVDVIANDSGGAVAQLLMVRWPDRVRTLLLTNCDVEPDSPPPALEPVIAMAREGTYPDRWLMPWFLDPALARSSAGIGGMCFSRPGFPSDAAIAIYLGPLVATPIRKALTNAYTLGLTPNPLAGIEAKLAACRVPTRILWGTGDTIFSRESSGYLDRLLPLSRGVRFIPEAKLFFPEEYPELIAVEARALWADA